MTEAARCCQFMMDYLNISFEANIGSIGLFENDSFHLDMSIIMTPRLPEQATSILLPDMNIYVELYKADRQPRT